MIVQGWWNVSCWQGPVPAICQSHRILYKHLIILIRIAKLWCVLLSHMFTKKPSGQVIIHFGIHVATNRPLQLLNITSWLKNRLAIVVFARFIHTWLSGWRVWLLMTIKWFNWYLVRIWSTNSLNTFLYRPSIIKLFRDLFIFKQCHLISPRVLASVDNLRRLYEALWQLIFAFLEFKLDFLINHLALQHLDQTIFSFGYFLTDLVRWLCSMSFAISMVVIVIMILPFLALFFFT